MNLSKILYRLGVFFFAICLSGCNDEKILDNLTQEQANQVLSVLQQYNISAYKNGNLKAGYAVAVNSLDNTVALSIINLYQLPWAADVHIAQAFPDSALVSSPGAEQARVRSLQEQRIEQSLRIIDQVVNAKVHISYPYNANNMSGHKPVTHIGILISYKGEIDNNIFISKIKNLIKNSIDDIKYENISVVLFNSPTIQHSAPLKINQSPSFFLILICVILGLLIILVAGFISFNHLKKHPRQAEKNMTDNQDNTITDKY